MKSLKSIFLSVIAIVAIASASHAQDTPKEATPADAKVKPQSKEEANMDFEARMAKFQQAATKMEAKAAKAKDPQMKADFDAMVVKMKQVSDEYNAMKNTAGASAQQQQEAKQKIRTEMEEIRKMHEDLKAKYGDQMGGKAKKAVPQQPSQDQQPPQKTQPEQETPK